MPEIRGITAPRMPDVAVTIEEVQAELSMLDGTKAEGQDELHPRLLKILAGVAAAPLTVIFNETLGSGVMPDDWRTAVLAPIYKGGGERCRVTTGR